MVAKKKDINKITAALNEGLDAPTLVKADHGLIRSMVRSIYDLQGIRIQMGNRITANFKAKLGIDLKVSEKEAAKQQKKILDDLRESYRRITDGIVIDGGEIIAKMPTLRKFKGDELITTYAELVLVSQYMRILNDEIGHFKQLNNVLAGVQIWEEFLKNIEGIGPAMAAIIISEIDITVADYPSSLWAYAGIDTVRVGVYIDQAGDEVIVPMTELTNLGDDQYIVTKTNTPVVVTDVGRSKKEWCLVDREYLDKNKEPKTRRSITFNPFLKTKLLGVLGGAFLRCGGTRVDGKKMSALRRMELAKSEGFMDETDENAQVLVLDFLQEHGHEVVVESSKYGKIYYDYKRRIENHEKHRQKTPGHRHAMALRYMIKMFLLDYWRAHRTMEGLPTPPSYAEAKLGIVHGELSPGKFPGGKVTA